MPITAFMTFISVLVAGAGGQQQRPVFREAVNAIVVDVFPQREGRIVEGLTRDDFAVYEDGRLQAIETFEFVRIEPAPADFVATDPNSQRDMLEQAADPQNRVFAVFLDTLHTSVAGSHTIRKPLVDLFDRQVAPGDLFGVITQNQRARDLVLGRVWDSVEAQLRRNWDWGQRHALRDMGEGMLTGLDPADPVEQALDYCFSVKIVGGIPVPWYIEDGAARRLFSEVLIDRRREDRVLASLEELVPYVGALREPRTSLMVVTDGWLLFPPDNDLAEHIADTDVYTAGPPQMRVAPTGRLTTRDPLDPIGMDRNTCNQEAVRLAGLDNPRRVRELITVANRENVSIYPINSEGLAAADAPMSVRTQPNPRAARGETLEERDRVRLRGRVEGWQMLAENTDAFAGV
jgi:VWFA-related protein